MRKFKTIVIDPPWKYGKWGKASVAPHGSSYDPQDSVIPYETMDISQIEKIPILNLADDNCELYFWVTQKYLPESFEIIKKWGFKYCQILTWCKKPKGTGQGGMYCPTTEFLILCRRGKMPTGKKRVNTTWWQVKRPMKHSQKPEEFQDIIEKQTDQPRLEMFARRKRDGWSVWGNEVNSDIEMEIK